MTLVPFVIEQTSRGERSYDIYSRLLKDRIVLSAVKSLMLWPIWSWRSSYFCGGRSDKDIFLYINNPGGSVTAGMAIRHHTSMSSAMWSPSASAWRRRWELSCWLAPGQA